MHILFVTGPGGAGRSTVAAATARAAHRAGLRVHLLGADPGDSLAEIIGPDPDASFGPDVTRVAPADDLREELAALQDRADGLFDLLGARPLSADEITPLPGAADFALLRAVRHAADRADRTGHELLVVDAPPLAETVDLLALPGRLRRYLARLLPAERQAARALRPLLAQLVGVPMPTERLYELAARWDEELAAVHAVLHAPGTAVRVVADPGPVGADALRLGTAALALHRLPVDALVLNRALPPAAASAEPWLAELAAQQERHAQDWAGPWTGTPLRTLPHLGRSPRGAADLDRLATPGVPRPERPEWTVLDRRAEDGVLVWEIPLPGARKPDVDLVRRGDELILAVGPHRRIVPLPAALRRCAVSGAALREGLLSVRFTPDPGQWPTRG
ncbi:ArsA family ATPase [Streptomyces sp. BI20]|uniref:ArsA family ATPase n=1 Tax=Streptomyces sp. BI20 TaxID=3403460 RepID=UPI003C73F107